MTTPTNHTRTEKLLLEAARIFNSTIEYEALIEQILRLVMTAVSARTALIFRVDHERTDIKIRMMHCDERALEIFHLELGAGVVGWVAQHREAVLINDAAQNPQVDPEIERRVGEPVRSLVTVPLIGRGQMLGVLEAINKTDGEFTEADLDLLIGLANQIGVALNNAHLYRVARREALEKHLLFEIGKKLSGSLRLDAVLAEILHSLKQAIHFDAGGVFVINADNDEVGSVYYEGYESGDDERVMTKVGQGLIGHVAKTGEPVVVSDVSKDNRYISARTTTRSEIVVPMVLDDRVIGVMNLESDTLNEYFPDDLSLMQAFATQAAVSIDRARLHEEMIAAKRLEEQLSIARHIQQSFLPDDDPVIPGYDISGRNVPSGQVGGDYFDFIKIVENQHGIAIADVSGKGIPAALIMASFRASLIAEIRNNYSIRIIAQKVNDLMWESVRSGRFVTGVYSVLDSRNHILTFTNCGHNLPILIRADGAIDYLREGGQVLGVTPHAVYEERPIFLAPGEVVVMYTDGVTEVFNDRDEEYGTERLAALVQANRGKTSQELVDLIHDTVRAWAGPQHVFDDLTMIILKRLG